MKNKRIVITGGAGFIGSHIDNVSFIKGDTKIAGEYYCRVFTQVYGIPTISLPYFNVYGPRQDAASLYAAVIPKFIARVKEDKPPIIYGDGKQTRDFIHVRDAIRANILAAESKTTGIFNIAKEKLDFTPKYSLEEGLKEMVKG